MQKCDFFSSLPTKKRHTIYNKTKMTVFGNVLTNFLSSIIPKPKSPTNTNQQHSHSISTETWGTQPVSPLNAQERPILLTTFDVIYAPLCIFCFFCSFLLMTKKLPRFHSASLRHYLAHYINPEHVYVTLKGVAADDETVQEQKQLEYGHLWFEMFGIVVLIFNLILNIDQTRLPFLILSISQMVLAFISIVTDFILLKKGYLHIVRGINSKLRFAHSSYQSLLFALDGMSAGGGLGTLPVDCYYLMISHYAYEAVGEILEGLHASGLGDFIIGLLIVAHAITNENLSTGKVAAFGVSCLGLSCASIIISMIYKLILTTKTKRRFVKDDHHHHNKHGDHDHEHGEEIAERLITSSSSSELQTVLDGDDNQHQEQKIDIPTTTKTTKDKDLRFGTTFFRSALLLAKRKRAEILEREKNLSQNVKKTKSKEGGGEEKH